MAGAVYFWQKFMQPDIAVTKHIEGKAEVPKEKARSGETAFRRMPLILLKEGELVSGRDRLMYLMEYYPESKTYEEAKRIVGEVNLDLLISKIPQEKKTEHIVRSGQALVTIARRSQTTIDYIMRANAKTTALIYPNEALTVYPLDFSVEIDLGRETLTVLDEDKFFKEYKILDQNFPPEFGKKVSTSISEKVAWNGTSPINFQDKNYLSCKKWIRTGKMGLFIRQKLDENEKEGGSRDYGVMLAKSDVEELFTILRVGTVIKVVN